MFFKIESWNFQHLFEIKFCETSQNFNSSSLFSQLFLSIFLSVVWLIWNFVRFLEILFQTDAESFRFLSWKIFLSRCQYQKKKALFTDPIFSEGFGPNLLKPLGTIIQKKCWYFYPSEPFTFLHFNMRHPVSASDVNNILCIFYVPSFG